MFVCSIESKYLLIAFALSNNSKAFGISEEEIVKYVGNGIINWGQLVTDVLDDIELRINQTRNSETTSLVTVLLEGIVHSSIA